MSGPVFKGTSNSLRDMLDERMNRYRMTLALQRDPNCRRADDYRRTIAMLIDMVAAIDRHRIAPAQTQEQASEHARSD